MMLSNPPFYTKFVKKTIQNKRKTDVPITRRGKAQKQDRKLRSNDRMQEPLVFGTPVFEGLAPQAKRILEAFPALLERILPLDSKKKALLPQYIQVLFHELTDERGKRSIQYLNDPVKRSAYVHYYLWWNLVRITKLVQHMQFPLEDHAVAADFGSGPLTFICALWIAKPDLRKKHITWYCVDISQKALAFGEELFLTLCAHTERARHSMGTTWHIKKVHGTFGIPLNEKVTLFTEANMFNEIFWNSPLSLDEQAAKACAAITQYVHPHGAVLLIEPGIPLAGSFLSLIRTQLLKKGFSIEAPCPHESNCPLPGKQYPKDLDTAEVPIAHGKWCHFVFDTADSPQALLRLSEAAHLGKERASLSFLYCSHKAKANTPTNIAVRICSDIILLGDHRLGRYACSEKGFVLLTSPAYQDSPLNKAVSGSMVFVSKEKLISTEQDKKTGAMIIAL
ncbi:MAG: small ribosomal subunit Rsm22 family protein [Treponema sp.]